MNIISNIFISKQEQDIFNLLKNISKKYNLNVTFRICGGWVRDRILGKESDDIDIALDKMTGSEFYEYCKQYEKENPGSGIGKAYTVAQNVEKSKHLETVGVDFFGIKIDFVNLRSETYGDSRVPEMKIGTPQEDALRRDLTINSLFYNINTSQVEDYVGGLQDLKTMTLRTPMDPKKTFIDDPLRALRVLRFYSRYPNSKIDPEIIAALRDPEVKNNYSSKVSPERSGPEIIKMIDGDSPSKAIRILFETGLDEVVFWHQERKNMKPLSMNQNNAHHKYNLLEHTLKVVENVEKIAKQKNISKEDRSLLLMASIFHDWGKAHPEIGKPKQNDPTQYSYVGHELKSADITEEILKRIGIPEDKRKIVNVIVSEHMRPHTNEWSNKSIGKFIKDTSIPGSEKSDIWNLVMIHAQADTMAKSDEGDQADYDLKEQHINQMREYKSNPTIKAKPLVNGNEIQSLFPDIKPKTGFIKYITDKLMEEQMSGDISEKNKAIEFINSLRQEIVDKFSDKPKTSSWWNKFLPDKIALYSPYVNKNKDFWIKPDGSVVFVENKQSHLNALIKDKTIMKKNKKYTPDELYQKAFSFGWIRIAGAYESDSVFIETHSVINSSQKNTIIKMLSTNYNKWILEYMGNEIVFNDKFKFVDCLRKNCYITSND